ncbi:effector-associated constant component EACC1 [Streptomyces sp. NPDC004752]
MDHRAEAVHAEIGAAAEDGELALLDLYRWLRQDPEARRHAEPALVPARQGAGTMGAVEVIDLVLGQGFAALNLALAYAAWRTARPAAPALTITSGDRSVTVQGDCDDDTVRRIVAALEGVDAERTGSADGARRADSARSADGARRADSARSADSAQQADSVRQLPPRSGPESD